MTCGNCVNRGFNVGAPETAMTFFTNLKLAMRLGIAFGALALALAITAFVSFSGLNGVEADAHELTERDISALLELVTISEDFLATDGDVTRHLYVEDGYLKAQDARAEKIAAWNKEADETLVELEPLVESEAGKETLAEFSAAYERYHASAAKAVELSRQETVDGVEERDGSRTLYTGTVLKELEGLDVIHDEIEGLIAKQAARAGRGGRGHRELGQARAPDRRRAGAARRGRPRVLRHAQRDAAGGGARRSTALARRARPRRAHHCSCGRPRGRSDPGRGAGHRAGRREVDRRARPALADVQRNARQDAAVDRELQRDARAARRR